MTQGHWLSWASNGSHLSLRFQSAGFISFLNLLRDNLRLGSNREKIVQNQVRRPPQRIFTVRLGNYTMC